MYMISAILNKFRLPSYYIAGNSRFMLLEQIYTLYINTGCFDQTIASSGDDWGLYYYVPLLASALNISIEYSTNVLFYSLIACAYVVGSVGLILYAQSPTTRFFALGIFTLLALYASRIAGSSTLFFCAASVTVPVVLWFANKTHYEKYFYPFLLGLGAFFALCNQIRIHSSTGALLFLITLLAFYDKRSFTKKILFLSALILGYASATYVFNVTIASHSSQAISTLPEESLRKHHVFWHSIYCGLGFLAPPINKNISIGFDDDSAFDRVRSLNPAVQSYSSEYENILKNETLSLFFTDWQFVIQTLFAKLGIIVFFFLYFGNVGILAAYYYRKPWPIDCAFFIALTFNALFGLLTIPTNYYLLGFISFSGLFNIISLCYAFNNGLGSINLKHRLRSWSQSIQNFIYYLHNMV